ncbi:hypothetical protein BGX23_005269, partial [Mortierella sp. AD031]
MEDVDDSGDKKNLQLQFLFSLITAIYSSKRPNLKEKEVAGKATIVPGMPANVCSFIDRAKDFLPEKTKNGTAVECLEYPGSSFLRSAAMQLCVELKKHYKNGSIDLCKKIEVLKNKGHLPHDARGFIDPKKSAVENFVLLNR